jgi:hypothetical protein
LQKYGEDIMDELVLVEKEKIIPYTLKRWIIN